MVRTFGSLCSVKRFCARTLDLHLHRTATNYHIISHHINQSINQSINQTKTTYHKWPAVHKLTDRNLTKTEKADYMKW